MCGLRDRRRALLQWQHLHERLLRQPLRWQLLRYPGLRRHRKGLRHLDIEYERASMRCHQCGHRHLHDRHEQLWRPGAGVLHVDLLEFDQLFLLRRARYPLHLQ